MSDFGGRYESPSAIAPRLQTLDKPRVIWYQSGQGPGAMQLAGQLGWLEQEFSPDAISCCAIAATGAMSGYATFGQGDLTATLQQQAIDVQQGQPGRLLLGLLPTARRWHLLLSAARSLQTAVDIRQCRFAVFTGPGTEMQGFATEQLISLLPAGQVSQSVALPGGELTNGQLYLRLYNNEFDAVLLDQQQLILLKKSAQGAELTLAEYDISRYQSQLQLSEPLTVDSLLWRHYPQLVLRFVSRVLDTEDWAVRHLEASADYLALTPAGRAELQLSQSLSFSFYQLTAVERYKSYLYRQRKLAVDFLFSDWIEALPLQILRSENGRQQVQSNRRGDPKRLQAVASLW